MTVWMFIIGTFTLGIIVLWFATNRDRHGSNTNDTIEFLEAIGRTLLGISGLAFIVWLIKYLWSIS